MSSQQPLSKPKVSSSYAQNELDKAEKQFEAYEQNIKDMTLDRMNAAPKEETEGPKISQKEIERSKEIWLKPKRSLPPGVDPKTGFKEKFNEKFRKDWEYAKEYVQFIAEHKEILGEPISDIWTKPFPGVNCESWDIPVNKPVWGPRYLAEQIKKSSYHRLRMDQSTTAVDGMGSYFGSMVVDNTVQRLDAHPVSQRKSVFIGASNF